MRVPQDPSRHGLPEPHGRRLLLRATVLALAAVVAVVPMAAAAGGERKQPGPSYQLSLQALGFPGFSSSFLGIGSSMLTLHYLDSSHLLLTFSMRKLVPRLPGDPETDEDRLVAAEVVDLPSGKIEAHTEWHMHDHARYLWSLGKGRFIVRIGDVLYAVAPLANLGTDQPFQLKKFPNRGAGLTTILVSPDYGLVTIETAVKDERQSAMTVGDVAQVSDTRTLIDFFRIHGDGSSASPLVVAHAGTVQSPKPLFLPLDADGYLWADDAGSGHWSMTFDGFTGKSAGLGNLDSSCWPRLQMVSPSEFVAMSCRGGDDRIKIASFGLDGHETWEESLGDFGAPTFAFAPAAGRFALSHVSTSGATASAVPPFGPTQSSAIPDETSRQEVRVYQNASGDLLLKVECSPVIKTAENFDLSADGSQLAVIRQGNIAIYKLPPLSQQDRADIAEVAKFAPAADSGPVLLHRLTTPPARASNRKQAPVAMTAQPAPAAATSDPAPAAASGDASPAEAPRQPPTLLNPGEKPDAPGKSTKPD